MHVKAKKIAFCGLLLALAIICMILGGILEMNTLFLLGAASFFVGIVIRFFGKRSGAAFYFAGLLLGLILVPNKFYVLTYGAMSLYILLREYAWEGLEKLSKNVAGKKKILWVMKYAAFNLMYVPGVLLFQKLLFTKELEGVWLMTVLLAGQVILLIYDGAYEYVQRNVGKWLGFLNSLE